MINLKLNKEEAQLMLDILSEKPYKEVFQLIDKIQVQANEQLAEPER